MVEKMNQEMGPERKFVYVNTKEFGSAEAEEGTRSNGKNDDLGGSSSTKPEGGLIQKLSEASTTATDSYEAWLWQTTTQEVLEDFSKGQV